MLLLSTEAAAAPTTFGTTVGSAMLCNDDIDPVYFKQYLGTFFKAAYKTEGDAYWFKVNTNLFGMKIKDVFVSTEDSAYAFLGATIEEDLQAAQKKLLEATGLNFQPEAAGSPYFRSPPGSYLVSYGPKQTKLFCVRRRPDRL